MQLYRHFDTDGDLLYVGVSLVALIRLNTHRNTSRWFDQIATVKIEHFDTKAEALAAETAAIIAENPRHNAIHNKNHRSFFRRARRAHLEMLYETVGRINRSDLISKFRISSISATADIKEFLKYHPDVAYDAKAKCYRVMTPLPPKDGEFV